MELSNYIMVKRVTLKCSYHEEREWMEIEMVEGKKMRKSGLGWNCRIEKRALVSWHGCKSKKLNIAWRTTESPEKTMSDFSLLFLFKFICAEEMLADNVGDGMHWIGAWILSPFDAEFRGQFSLLYSEIWLVGRWVSFLIPIMLKEFVSEGVP